MAPVPLIRVIRSGVEESVHLGDVVVVDRDGAIRAFAGDPDRVVFARSSMKPLQAAVSLSLVPFAFTDPEVAVMCASHNGEPIHVAAVRSLLARAGMAEADLLCPSVWPMDEESAARAPERRPIYSDCSGKHGGMLAACHAQGWDSGTYPAPDHPLQQRVLRAVARASGQEPERVGADGCGVPVHAMPLRAMATIYARLAVPERLGDLEPFAARAVEAMRAEPYMVAGRNRPDTAVMEVVPAVIAKGGAEGLMCAALLDQGLGLAVKVGDGTARASGPVLIHALHQLGLVDEGRLARLEPFARPAVLGGGRPVGNLLPAFSLVTV